MNTSSSCLPVLNRVKIYLFSSNHNPSLVPYALGQSKIFPFSKTIFGKCVKLIVFCLENVLAKFSRFFEPDRYFLNYQLIGFQQAFFEFNIYLALWLLCWLLIRRPNCRFNKFNSFLTGFEPPYLVSFIKFLNNVLAHKN